LSVRSLDSTYDTHRHGAEFTTCRGNIYATIAVHGECGGVLFQGRWMLHPTTVTDGRFCRYALAEEQ
jgi:hypothetical protein